eukprot:TRINITY_DN6872_c2_g1_i1.p3 TRINITY_DN6872_c2_g1~~TRINITY_DN6872_c2_g1_i1.p3  ORF type:complete len:103 (+),score=58.71 TRINITY_DN6872_c2_g1_i1:118-426(+)
MAFRLTVFKEFAKKEALAKVPANVTVEIPEQDWPFEAEKRSEQENELLATNAKLFFNPKEDTAVVKETVAALVALGFKVVKEFPVTSTGHTMEDRIILAMTA